MYMFNKVNLMPSSNDRLTVYLLEAIKEQQQRINALEETVTQYESLSERLNILELTLKSSQDMTKIVTK